MSSSPHPPEVHASGFALAAKMCSQNVDNTNQTLPVSATITVFEGKAM